VLGRRTATVSRAGHGVGCGGWPGRPASAPAPADRRAAVGPGDQPTRVAASKRPPGPA